MIEWETNFTGLPIGEPLMLCVHDIGVMKDYAMGPIYALGGLGGELEFYSVESKKRLPNLCVYAWAPWPKPLERKVGKRL